MRERTAQIKDTFLGREDHGIMTCYITMDYGASAQSFGGYFLERTDFLSKILDVLEVRSWEKLPGTPCRVRHDSGKIFAIGHFIKDQWFNPGEDLK